MKYMKNICLLSSILLLSLSLASCVTDTSTQEQNTQMASESTQPDKPLDEQVVKPAVPPSPTALPVRYQTASYLVDSKAKEDISLAEESKLKVGARITSSRGPQPLWDILKRLAALKKMNVSWSSDVDQNVLVDVNINANDDFFLAIDNLLRQVDYSHEVQGSTIIVKYKETRQYHIAMPFIKQSYKTNTGGDVLGSSGEGTSTNVAGEISLATDGVAINNLRDGTPGDIEFNTWSSIENNLNSILNIWSTEEITSEASVEADITEFNNQTNSIRPERNYQTDSLSNEQSTTATFRKSSGANTYFIDKPVGLITVTAPRPLLEKLDIYFKNLKRELYKQISIEAKIIEVQLDDYSSIGLNWNLLLRNLSMQGAALGGSSYDRQKINDNSSRNSYTRSRNVTDSSTFAGNRSYDYTLADSLLGDTGTSAYSSSVDSFTGTLTEAGAGAATVITNGLSGSIGGAISLAAFSFDSFLNAVNEQGQATILSNPKLSVLNGQPSLMTVGRNVSYISKIESDTDGNTGTVTYSVETNRALSGVGLALTANILEDNEVILNLVPVTSELVEPIEYRQIGLGEVGLPIINVREMSTTVRVKDGEMLVIGGLISSVEDTAGTFVPGTSKIPFVKYLFGYEEKISRKRELIILLKPRII